jgi:hypothetical protein
MNKFTNPLNNIKIASPCSQDWNAMSGDTRKRFCSDCKLNVYNLSGMTKAEAENLLMNSEGRLCVRFYRRSDGTVLTQDCPVGWAAFKRRVSKTTAAFASLLFGVISGLGLTGLLGKSERERGYTTGVVAVPTPNRTPKTTPTPGDFIMGDVAMPEPTPQNTPKSQDYIMGKVAAPKNNQN